MAKAKKLGIWMDHSAAHLMEFTIDPIVSTTVESKFSQEAKELSLDRDEDQMHSKEQHQQFEYYKKLGDIIRNYEEVVLFGPTDAKQELLNTLKNNQLFKKIKIEVKSATKMTENQQHAFVRSYFSI